MKPSDLVEDLSPNYRLHTVLGLIINEYHHPKFGYGNNRTFRVLWADGTIGNNVWDYHLKVFEIDEDR